MRARLCLCWKKKEREKVLSTHQIGGDNEGHVHNASVEKSDTVCDVDTIPWRPFAHLDESVRLQFEQIKFDVGPPAFAELHRSRYTAILDLTTTTTRKMYRSTSQAVTYVTYNANNNDNNNNNKKCLSI